MEKKYGLNNINYISLIALMCIVLTTISGSIVNNYYAWSILGIIGGLIQTVGKIGFPLTIMVSGYLISQISEDIYEFYKNLIKKVIIPFLVYSTVYNLLSLGKYNNLWYIRTFIGILILAPFIRLFIINISDKLLKILIIMIIIMRFIQIYLPILGFNFNIDLLIFDNWIVFCILGYGLTKIKSEKTKKKIYKLGFICFILTFILRTISLDTNVFSISPTMMLYSSAVFLKLQNLKFKEYKSYIHKYLDFVNKHKLGIYFTHNFIIVNILQEKINLSANRFKVIGGIILVFIITLLLASILAFIVDKYILPVINKILKCLFKKIKINKFKANLIDNKQYIIWIILSFGITFLLETISRGSINQSINFCVSNKQRFIINYIIILAITSPCLLFNRIYFVFTIISSILLTLSFASYAIINFRGTPLTYSDFYSIKDGMGVAKEYINLKMIIGIFIYISIIAFIAYKTFSYKIRSKYKLNKLSIVVIPIVIILMNFSIYIGVNKGILVPNQWDLKVSYDDNGFSYSLYNSYYAYKRKKPRDYNEKTINNINKNISKCKKNKDNEETPNIILVQIESVMDPMNIKGLRLNKDPLKNFRKLSKKYSSGILKVPTFGGGTARTEFEVLTGMSLDYFSPGEIPHNNDLKKQAIESLAYTLDSNKYEKTLIHNFEGSFYGRNKAYENLGFERYIPIEYMHNVKYPDVWPSDESVLENIKNVLESTKKRDFIFGIGVQTHGSYRRDYKSENSKVKASGDLPKEQLNQIQDYIDDLVMVDEFVGNLANYVESLDEPTILAVYSDHLPALDAVNQNINKKDKYSTEYFICDNMELKKEDKDLEAYKLSTRILDLINIKGGIMNKFHRAYENSTDYKNCLKLIQYDMLYGNKYISNKKTMYKKSNLKMGLNEIKITDVKINENAIEVIGSGFNESSCINVDGKQIETEYKNNKKLVGKINNDKINKITVSQLSRYKKSIGDTKPYIIKK